MCCIIIELNLCLGSPSYRQLVDYVLKHTRKDINNLSALQVSGVFLNSVPLFVQICLPE